MILHLISVFEIDICQSLVWVWMNFELQNESLTVWINFELQNHHQCSSLMLFLHFLQWPKNMAGRSVVRHNLKCSYSFGRIFWSAMIFIHWLMILKFWIFRWIMNQFNFSIWLKFIDFSFVQSIVEFVFCI